MAVTNTATIKAELGNGSKVAFDFAFKVFASSDLKIYKETAAGVYTEQTIVADWGADPDPIPAANTCFVVFDTVNETGTVTYSEAPEAGLASVVVRDSAETQGTNFPTEEKWSRKSVENALDKLTLLTQEIQERINRSPLQPIVPAEPDAIEIEAPVDAKGLRWRYEAGEGKWYIESTTYDPDAQAVLAAASASAASASALAAATSASEAAESAEAATEIQSGTIAERPVSPTSNLYWWATDREELSRYVVPASKWIILG